MQQKMWISMNKEHSLLSDVQEYIEASERLHYVHVRMLKQKIRDLGDENYFFSRALMDHQTEREYNVLAVKHQQKVFEGEIKTLEKTIAFQHIIMVIQTITIIILSIFMVVSL